MTLLLVLIALAVLGLTAAAAVGRIPGGLEPPVRSLPPVGLPDPPRPADLDRLRFAVALRGYRMDQVDAVLDRLRDRLVAQDREIDRLRARLDRPDRPEGVERTE